MGGQLCKSALLCHATQLCGGRGRERQVRVRHGQVSQFLWDKLTWLALGDDQAARFRRVEQLMAL